jgi:hypothetical protein
VGRDKLISGARKQHVTDLRASLYGFSADHFVRIPEFDGFVG